MKIQPTTSWSTSSLNSSDQALLLLAVEQGHLEVARVLILMAPHLKMKTATGSHGTAADGL
jgi:hypothetical protein